MDKRNQTREANGQYNHALAAMCKCGNPKGAHDAVRPYPLEDADCERFRIAK